MWEQNDIEFVSSALDSNHPYINPSILKQIYQVCPRFVLEWELQPDGMHRWHLKMHRADGKTDPPVPVMLIQEPEWVSMYQSGEYRPVDGKIVRKIREIWYFNQKPREFIRRVQESQDEAKEQQDKDMERSIADWALYYRRAFARLSRAGSGGNPDSYWGSGYSREDGRLVSGSGPKSRMITEAI